ncbi:MAG: hypothetical protein D6835_04180, partial [Candidatus Thermofonsia bacterium]
GAILLGALASVYGKEAGGSDTAVWLASSKDKANTAPSGIGSPSIAHQTIEALRQAGLLDDVVTTRAGLVRYPMNLDAENHDTV